MLLICTNQIILLQWLSSTTHRVLACLLQQVSHYILWLRAEKCHKLIPLAFLSSCNFTVLKKFPEVVESQIKILLFWQTKFTLRFTSAEIWHTALTLSYMNSSGGLSSLPALTPDWVLCAMFMYYSYRKQEPKWTVEVESQISAAAKISHIIPSSSNVPAFPWASFSRSGPFVQWNQVKSSLLPPWWCHFRWWKLTARANSCPSAEMNAKITVPVTDFETNLWVQSLNDKSLHGASFPLCGLEKGKGMDDQRFGVGKSFFCHNSCELFVCFWVPSGLVMSKILYLLCFIQEISGHCWWSSKTSLKHGAVTGLQFWFPIHVCCCQNSLKDPC